MDGRLLRELVTVRETVLRALELPAPEACAVVRSLIFHRADLCERLPATSEWRAFCEKFGVYISAKGRDVVCGGCGQLFEAASLARGTNGKMLCQPCIKEEGYFRRCTAEVHLRKIRAAAHKRNPTIVEQARVEERRAEEEIRFEREGRAADACLAVAGVLTALVAVAAVVGPLIGALVW